LSIFYQAHRWGIDSGLLLLRVVLPSEKQAEEEGGTIVGAAAVRGYRSGDSPVGCLIWIGETFVNSTPGWFNSTPGGVDANGNDVVQGETTNWTWYGCKKKVPETPIDQQQLQQQQQQQQHAMNDTHRTTRDVYPPVEDDMDRSNR